MESDTGDTQRKLRNMAKEHGEGKSQNNMVAKQASRTMGLGRSWRVVTARRDTATKLTFMTEQLRYFISQMKG